jgi:hypothetical protein
MRAEGGRSLLWFLAGASVGVALGVVLAPKAGAATRRLIALKAHDAREFLSHSGMDYYERGRDLYERGRHLADEAAELFDEGRRLVEHEEA